MNELEDRALAAVVYTGELTTDPDTFDGEVVVNLGAPAAVKVTVTGVTLDGDGETFGEGENELGAISTFTHGYDGENWNGMPIFQYADVNGLISSVGHVQGGMVLAHRYVRLVTEILDETTGDPYAGANNPVATLSYEIRATAL